MPSLRRDLDFLYNRPRLNVAVSRAKAISIVISSEGVLNPPAGALVDKGNLEGFTYIKAYEDRAWSLELDPITAMSYSDLQPECSSQEQGSVRKEGEMQDRSPAKTSQRSSQQDDVETEDLLV
jgi:hypothetical protein